MTKLEQLKRENELLREIVKAQRETIEAIKREPKQKEYVYVPQPYPYPQPWQWQPIKVWCGDTTTQTITASETNGIAVTSGGWNIGDAINDLQWSATTGDSAQNAGTTLTN